MKCNFCEEPAVYKKRALCSKHYHKVVKADRSIKSHTPEYAAWMNMKRRCTKLTDPEYPNYGGRGITVCESWVNNFERFLEDVGLRPSNKHSIDRINNDKGYEPHNCRWATQKEQQNNKRLSYITAGRLAELLEKEQILDGYFDLDFQVTEPKRVAVL